MDDLKTVAWWQWLPVLKWRVVGVVDSADHVPVRLPRNGVVLVGSSTKPKWIAFDCPCRTGHRIMLNADQSRWPHWSLSGRKRLTIVPSIDYKRTTGRCHYLVRNGRVQWV